MTGTASSEELMASFLNSAKQQNGSELHLKWLWQICQEQSPQIPCLWIADQIGKRKLCMKVFSESPSGLDLLKS